MSKYRLVVLNVVLGAAVLGGHWGRQIDAAVVNAPAFLQTVALPYRNWKTVDEELPKSDLEVLQPDAALARVYRGPTGDQIELVVVAGHRKRSVHTPGYCMLGGGWETVTQEACELPLPNGKIPASRMVMARNGERMVATYFFTDGDYSTDSVLKLQGAQLWKRMRSEIPLGALVRFVVPVRTTTQDADRLTDDFARETLPPLLRSLRGIHLTPR